MLLDTSGRCALLRSFSAWHMREQQLKSGLGALPSLAMAAATEIAGLATAIYRLILASWARAVRDFQPCFDVMMRQVECQTSVFSERCEAHKYLVVQVVVQVVAHEEVEQSLLAILVMLQHSRTVEAQQLAAQNSKALCSLLLTTSVPLEDKDLSLSFHVRHHRRPLRMQGASDGTD